MSEQLDKIGVPDKTGVHNLSSVDRAKQQEVNRERMRRQSGPDRVPIRSTPRAPFNVGDEIPVELADRLMAVVWPLIQPEEAPDRLLLDAYAHLGAVVARHAGSANPTEGR